MSGVSNPGGEAVDHQEQAAYVAISRSTGNDRRLHRVAGDPDSGELQNGEECEVACRTTLTTDESVWKAKPAHVYPVGFRSVCTHPDCFGENGGAGAGAGDVDAEVGPAS